jgi:hypothetical protein
MTRSLRKRHRRILVCLGILLPVAFAWGLAARKPVPTVNSIPGADADVARFADPVWMRTDLFTNPPLRVRLLRETSAGGRTALELTATGDLVKPDVIVYWVRDGLEESGMLPDSALFLGAFGAGVPLVVPRGIGNATGAIVLYSLADGEIIGVSRPCVIGGDLKVAGASRAADATREVGIARTTE